MSSTSKSFDLEIRDEVYFAFKNAKIQNSDVVLLHSDISKNLIRYKKRDTNFKLSTLIDIITEYFSKGTLIVPTFNFNFCEKGNYEYLNTPSKMGIITEEIRKENKFLRTSHPVYSFVVLGNKNRMFLDSKNFEAFSKNSPFGLLTDLDGKIISWNLPDQKSMTYYHFIERENKVIYRFDKIFVGNYTNKENKTSKEKYSIFVRDIDKGVVTNVEGMEKILWENNLYYGDKFDSGSGLRSIKVIQLYKKVTDVINKNLALGNLYNIK